MFNLAMGARWAGERSRNRYRKWASKNFLERIISSWFFSWPESFLFFGISCCWNEFGFHFWTFDELVRVRSKKIRGEFKNCSLLWDTYIFLFSVLDKIEDHRANPLSISLTFVIMINKRIMERKPLPLRRKRNHERIDSTPLKILYNKLPTYQITLSKKYIALEPSSRADKERRPRG